MVKPLIARQIKFDFRSFAKKYWFDDNPIKTIYANSVTASIPFGERFIVYCTRSIIPEIKDKAQRKQALLFAKQEANHSREHFRLYRHLVKPFYPKLNFRKNLFYKISIFFAFLIGKKLRVATVAATEHFTAAISETYLLYPELLASMDKNVRLLWLWHFIEEIEHRHCAFDLLIPARCGYISRILGLFIATGFIMLCFITTFLHMVFYDRLFLHLSFYKQFFLFLKEHKQFIYKLLVALFSYFKPNYHPNQYVTAGLMASWQARMMELEEEMSR